MKTGIRARKTGLYLASATLAVALLALWMTSPPFGDASSHREAPLIAMDPTADVTDVYSFVSPNDPSKVTLIMNVYPFEEPAGGPNFFRLDDNVLYEIKVDNDDDAVEDITFQFRTKTTIKNPNTFLYNTGPINTLGDATYNYSQSYTVTRKENGSSTVLGSDLLTPPENIGPASTPDYDALAGMAVHTLSDGTKSFVGQRDDPFWVDLGAVFDLLTIRPAPPGDGGGGVDGLGGFNVHTLAVEVPIELLTQDGEGLTGADDPDAVIGVWATTSRRTTTVLGPGTRDDSGPWVQISRLGLPLINEVIIPLSDKDKFNGTEPKDDLANFGSFVLDPEPARLINLIYGIPVPDAPRTDLVPLLTGFAGLNEQPGVTPSDMQRLNMAVPPKSPGDAGYSSLGVIGGDISGFPNGRRLGDDVVDVELRVLAGVLVPEFNQPLNNRLGDNLPSNDRPFMDHFPFVASPWQGFDHEHHAVGVAPDDTPPVCGELEIIKNTEGKASAVRFSPMDAESGIASIEFVTLKNATGMVNGNGPFSQGDIVDLDLPYPTAVNVRGDKVDAGKRAVVVTMITNGTGLTAKCDPVYETVSAEVPYAYVLEENYPNPFNPSTRIRFAIPSTGQVNLSIYDVQGRLVRTLVEQQMDPGTYSMEWDGRDLAGNSVASGTYIYRLVGQDFIQARKMILMK